MIIDLKTVEDGIHALGTEIFQQIAGAKPSIFDPQFYSAKLMDWAMQDEEFKISLFRFVDVFPYLADSGAVIRHAQEYFDPVADKIPGLLKWGLRVDPQSLSAKIAAPVLGRQIRSMGSRFIVGETPQEALRALRQIRQNKFAFTVDLLGEANVSEAEALQYLKRYLELLDVLGPAVTPWRESQPIVEGHKGEVTPVNISVKASALYSQARAVAADQSIAVLSERFAEILARAMQHGAFVYLDMEDTSLTTITIEMFKRVLERPEFASFDRVGIVLQAYLRRTEEDCDALLKWVRSRGVPIAIRLVKGAYWDTETIVAQQRGWPIPVWTKKSSTDANYERVALKLLGSRELVLPAFASHNLRSLCFVVKAAEALGVSPAEFELQALYGMGEPVKKAFSDRGYLVREYAPIGDLVPGMGYLVRRLLENTSNEGFLRQSFHEHANPAQLLAAPAAGEDSGREHLEVKIRERFMNSAPRDYSLQPVREALEKQLTSLRNKFKSQPEQVKPVVAGKYLETQTTLASLSPEEPECVLAEVHLADSATAEEAVKDLQDFFPVWRNTPAAQRAEVLFRAAELLESRRDEITAVIVLESGKSWQEADGDIAEAIDFCCYYAHEALRLAPKRQMGSCPGEFNTYFYEPRGIALVVSPWNFPLSIPCGMFAAALVTGNCAILKPAGQTCLIARYLFDTFLAAGLPERAAAFLPAKGSETGAYLVKHPQISTIAFTGSKEVGLGMIEEAGKTKAGAEQVKRVIAEMGGKNAIIVDDDADLDEAVHGVIASAFGYQGQKCSACSRVIVVGAAYDRFLDRVAEGVKSIVLGPASDPATFVGPVIDRAARDRILGVIEDAKRDCRLVVEGGDAIRPLGGGFYVKPTVFADIPAGHQLLKEEIFGPVLAVMKAKDFDEAIALALDSEFALTGAVYSRSPAHIETAVQRFRVGNLYINRGSTGALVMRQPFGGFKMSGVGSKTGGPDYLLQFVVPRSVSENTMRRGFAPELTRTK